MNLRDKVHYKTKTSEQIPQREIERIKIYLMKKIENASERGNYSINIPLIKLIFLKKFSKNLIKSSSEWLEIEGFESYIYTEEDRSNAEVGHKPQSYLYVSWK